MLNYVKRGKSIYDDLCLLNLRTENGLVGRVVQDGAVVFLLHVYECIMAVRIPWSYFR